MKKIISLILAVLMLVCVASTAFAVYEGYTEEEYAALDTVTVIKTDESPTGYMVSFRYVDPEATQVFLYGEWAYRDAEGNKFTAEEWKPGLINNGGTLYDLTKNEAGIWTVDVPMPSGQYSYQFQVGGDPKPADVTGFWIPTGATMSWDPTNRPMNMDAEMKTDEAYDYYMSTVYVPFDAEKQTEDFSVEGPRSDEYVGKVEFLTLSDETVGEQPMTLYLPYNYDPAKTYKLLVLFHGGGGFYANWINSGAADSIADNLIAEGKFSDDTLILMPDGTKLDFDGANTLAFLKNVVIPYLQENYNISTAREDMAFSGLSMGGILTSYMLFNAQDTFQTFAIFSGSHASSTYSFDQFKGLVGSDLNILVAVGEGDIAYDDIMGVYSAFDTLGVEYTKRVTAGGHNWYTWRKDLAYLLENFLWK